MSSSASEKYFLWFSDIHYDPYYATKDAVRAAYNTKAVCNSTSVPSVGSIGCDSPKALIDSALEYASEIAASPSFIILSGDSIRHGVDMLYASSNHEGNESRVGNEVEMAAKSEYHIDAMEKAGDIINELASIFAEAFPDVEIIVSLGNNDVVPDYYLQLQQCDTSTKAMTPEDSGMLGIIYNALLGNTQGQSSDNIQVGEQRKGQSLLSAEDSTYLKGGYYSRVLPDGLTVLSINTVLYSTIFGPEPLNADDPGGQFAWMRNMLINIRERGNSQAIIVGHIPPANGLLNSHIKVFNVVGRFRHTQLWKEKYINAYYEIIQEFDDVIVGQLFGHLHSDEFRVGVGRSAIPSSLSTPLLLAGSLTPLHGNNPSFRKVFYGGGGLGDDSDNQYRLLDYESHRYPISDSNGEWAKLYTFSETYNTATDNFKAEGLSGNAFRSIIQSMKDKQGNMKTSPILQSFLSLVRSRSDGDIENHCDAECRAEWICTLAGTTTINQYNKCLLQERGSGRYIAGIAGATLFAAAVLFIIAVRIRRRRKRAQYESAAFAEGNVEVEDHEML